MTTDKAKALQQKAKKYFGQEVKLLSKDGQRYVKTAFKFNDTVSFTWKVNNEKPTVDL
jgi:hypothetical protein